MRGIFLDGCVSGLGYGTAAHCGQLDDGGYFEYEPGETIRFFIGGLTIGTAQAKEIVTPLDFAAEARGRHTTVSHYLVVNTARLLMGLGRIDDTIRTAAEQFRYDIDFMMETEKFERLPALQAFLEAVGKKLASPALAKNTVRRCAAGIRLDRDVKIPMKDGGYVLADVWRPLKEGKVPAVMCMGIFGKAFINGFVLDEEAEELRQIAEDRFYDDYARTETKQLLQRIFLERMACCDATSFSVPNPDPEEILEAPDGPPACLVPVSEAFEQPCAYDWVPYGYAVINIEERGIGKNRTGEPFCQFGAGNARDYCEAIEWAADQPWSTGKVGLFGASYYAMTQYLAAQRHPKGLAAMIPIMGDYDSYRDYVYSGGGLLNIADNSDPSMVSMSYNFMNKALDEPFWNEETYGPEGQYMSSADIRKIDLPIFICVEPDASLHGKGSSEAYINCASADKKLMVVAGAGIHFWMYGTEYMEKFRAFFDRWLKGEENGIMDEPRVGLQMRTGDGGYYWRHEADWPVPGTEYVKFYLDGTKLKTAPAAEEKTVEYNADVHHRRRGRVEGATFTSAPLKRNLEIAGYIKAGLYVSANVPDMEIHMNVRVLDENDREVIYPAETSMERALSLGFGAMKVSHRELDEARSREDLPVYKHTKEAYAPLQPDEVVYAEIGTFPTTGVIKKGWKIQVDIDPAGFRWVCFDEEAYRKGAVNRIHTGGGTPSFLQLPVLPKRK